MTYAAGAWLPNSVAEQALFFWPTFGWILPGIISLLHKDQPEIAKHASEASPFQRAMTGVVWDIGVLGSFFCFLFAPISGLVDVAAWSDSIRHGASAGVNVSNGEQF